MNVPLLDLKAQYAQMADQIDSAIASVVKSQYFILGPEVQSFEEEIGAYIGAAHSVGVASGSDALVLSMMARDVGHGDEVITTPFTFFATAGSIARLHAKLVFVDIEPDTFNIDVDATASAISANTAAIMPVHLFGQCADMDRLNALGSDLVMVEDACQSIGATHKGKAAGTMGDFGCFSFFPSKNLGGFGDGGLVTVKDEAAAQRVRKLRTHGGAQMYHYDYVGLNSRLDALQAAVLRVKLKKLDEWTDARRKNAGRYAELFETAGVTEVRLPVERADNKHVYSQYTVRCDRRDDLRAFLKERGVGSGVYYPKALHLQPCFEKAGYKQGEFPVSEKACEEVLSLPVFPELTEDMQAYVVEQVRAFYKG